MIDCQVKCNKINEKFIKHFEGSTKTKAFTGTIIDEINNMLNRFPDLAKKICRKLCYKFTDDESYIKHELKFSGPNVLCLKLIPEHITGKLVNES